MEQIEVFGTGDGDVDDEGIPPPEPTECPKCGGTLKKRISALICESCGYEL